MIPSRKINVVLVDDSQAFCDAMQFYFKMIDKIKFLVFDNAAHFLKNIDNHLPDVLLLDLFMPGIDGITLLHELKTKNKNLYTIVISGHADKQTASQIKKMGANDFLSKPFSMDYLLEKIFFISQKLS